jgi:hypothetical protein
LQPSSHGGVILLLSGANHGCDAVIVVMVIGLAHLHIPVTVTIFIGVYDDRVVLATGVASPTGSGGGCGQGGLGFGLGRTSSVGSASEVCRELRALEEQLYGLHGVIAGYLQVALGNPLVVSARDGQELSDVLIHGGGRCEPEMLRVRGEEFGGSEESNVSDEERGRHRALSRAEDLVLAMKKVAQVCVVAVVVVVAVAVVALSSSSGRYR